MLLVHLFRRMGSLPRSVDQNSFTRNYAKPVGCRTRGSHEPAADTGSPSQQYVTYLTGDYYSTN